MEKINQKPEKTVTVSIENIEVPEKTVTVNVEERVVDFMANAQAQTKKAGSD